MHTHACIYMVRVLVNPRRACAARVTAVGSVCVSVCLSVKSHLTYGASVRPENAVTYYEGQKFVGFSLKPLRCRDPALPPLYGHAYSRPFFHAYFSCTRMHISAHAYFSCIYAHDTPPRRRRGRGFSTSYLHVHMRQARR